MAEEKKFRWGAIRLRGLRQRWIINTVMPVFILIVLIVVLFSAGVSSYYYGTMQKGLETRAQAIANSFNEYFMDSGYISFYPKAVQAADSFEDKDRIELQFISSSGRIQVSTSGLTAGTSPGTGDITQAIETAEMAPFRGWDPETGENIMAVSHPLVFHGNVVGVMRLVTSLRAANRQVMLAVLAICLIALLCMVLIVISNLLFINNVVEPVAVVSEAAKRIAAGSYGVQIQTKYRDEIGALADTINEMSNKIAQNEKMQSEFISQLSHELRTPLTVINGWSETLLADENMDAETRQGMKIISSEAKRLTDMVMDLLDFTRMQDGRMTLAVEMTDLRSEYEDTVFMYGSRLSQDGIQLIYKENDEDIPEIPCDPQRMRQVFLNILDNAAKHGGAGKRIETDIHYDGEQVIVRIRDFGPGIPEDELPLVKKKFYKGSSSVRGTGIGLAVCDEIVEMHGGTLTLENAEGGGTLVTVRLPAAH